MGLGTASDEVPDGTNAKKFLKVGKTHRSREFFRSSHGFETQSVRIFLPRFFRARFLKCRPVSGNSKKSHGKKSGHCSFLCSSKRKFRVRCIPQTQNARNYRRRLMRPMRWRSCVKSSTARWLWEDGTAGESLARKDIHRPATGGGQSFSDVALNLLQHASKTIFFSKTFVLLQDML